MKPRSPHLVFCSSLVLCLFIAPVGALSAVPLQDTHPDEVHLEVRTASNQTRFYIGEVIPLELLFSSAVPDRYMVSLRNHDRWGDERFRVEPSQGWVDPNPYGSLGGISGVAMLSDAPRSVGLRLNEWIRFDLPGLYRVQVTSTRVADIGGETPMPVEVVSNTIEIRIVGAPEAWQNETLDRALAVLDDPNVDLNSRNMESSAWEAVRTLRFLGTAAAAEAMAVRLRGEKAWDSDFSTGLRTTPARGEARAALERLLEAPDFPVTGSVVSTLAGLDDRSREAMARYWRRLSDALPRKEGEARLASARTLLSHGLANDDSIQSAGLQLAERIVAERFESMEPADQTNLLRSSWVVLDEPSVLERIARRYPESALPATEVAALNAASAAALERWYRFEPERARAALLEEIRRPQPRFGADVLGMLPDQTIPEIDMDLARSLQSLDYGDAFTHVASLIERYATQAIESQVVTTLDPYLGRGPCRIQELLLAYLVRVDPASVEPRIDKVMQSRERTGCYRSLVPNIGALETGPVLEAVALRYLDDPEPLVVSSLAEYLRQHGSAGAEAALWARLAAWTAEWRGRESELRSSPLVVANSPLSAGEHRLAGSALLRALAEGHGWLVDETGLLRLRELSLTDDQRNLAERYLSAWRRLPWSVRYTSGTETIELLQYRLESTELAKSKLDQFPPGTVFRWAESGAATGDAGARFRELADHAQTRGILITLPDGQPR